MDNESDHGRGEKGKLGETKEFCLELADNFDLSLKKQHQNYEILSKKKLHQKCDCSYLFQRD